MLKVFFEGELKIKVRGGVGRDDLLTAIGAKWKEGGLKPVFVSEGSSSEKVSSIGRSDYLRVVYEKLIPSKVGDGLVVYGWGMHENDCHILEAVKLGGIKRVAVSVFRDEGADEYCQHVRVVSKRSVLILSFISSGQIVMAAGTTPKIMQVAS